MDTSQIVKIAEKAGAESAEVFLSTTRNFNFFIEKSSVTNLLKGSTTGFAVRLVKGGRFGFSYGNDFSAEGIKSVINNALTLSKFGDAVPNGFSFPTKKAKGSVKDTYDKKIAGISESSALDIAKRLAEPLRPQGISIGFGRLKFTEFSYEISNSTGLEAKDKGTFVLFYSNLVKKHDGRIVEYEPMERFRMLSQFSPESIAEESARFINSSLSPKTVKAGKYPVIFSPKVMAELFATTLGEALSGNAILMKASPFFDKLGDKIAHESFSLFDDGRYPAGVASTNIDQEGTETQTTPLVDKGMLKNFFYDSHYAAKAGTKTTGNGRRGGISYDEYFIFNPTVSNTNIVVLPGRKSLEDIIAETKNGLLLEKVAWPRGSSTNGSFSLEIRNAFAIRGGELQEPVRWGNVVGSVYEAIKRISGISKQTFIASPFPTGLTEAAVLPYIRFEDMDVVAKAS